MPPAVVLVSGGLDSAVTAAIARQSGFDVHPLSVDYGQRHRFELQAATRVARSLGLREPLVVRVELSRLAPSALTAGIQVPKGRDAAEMAAGIPVTYVPARNTVLLSLALGYAESLWAADLFIGVNAVDYSGYPDCRGEYIAAFQNLARLATKAGVEGRINFTIHTPLIHMAKAQIVERGARLGLDFSLTHTCYDPAESGRPCGRCDACLLRRKGFAEAGLADPLDYPT